MFGTQTGPIPPLSAGPGIDGFDSACLTRALSEAGGAESTLPLRLLSALQKALRAGAGRVWLNLGDPQPALVAESGTTIPLPAPLRTVSTARVIRIGSAACAVVRIQDLEPREAAAWAHQQGYTSAILLSLTLCGQESGRFELFVSQPPTPAALEGLDRFAPWLGLAGAHAVAQRRCSLTQDFVQQLVCLSPTAIVASDLDGRIRLWNPAAERLLGVPAAHALRQSVRTVPPERAGEFEQLRQYVLSGKSVSNLESLRQRADGSTLPVMLSAAPHFDEQGNAIGMIELLTDHSAQRRALRQLQVERRILEILEYSETVELAGSAVLQTLCEALEWSVGELWLVDSEAEHLEVSSGWSRLLYDKSAGKSQRRRVKRGDGLAGAIWNAGQATHMPRLDEPLKGLPSHLEQGAGFGLPITYRRQMLGVLAFRDALLEDPSPEIRQALDGISAMLGQFLHQKRTEEALAQANARLRQTQKMDAVGLLAGGIAHDFNNVLTVILSYSEIGAEEVSEDDPVHDMLVEIHNAGRRAASMTRRLLTFSRQHNEEFVLVNLNQLVTEMDRMMRRLIGPSITLQTGLSPDLGAIRADASQIDQLLVNFVVNARDAISQGTGHGRGGSITVSTRNATLSSAEAHHRPGARAGEYVVLSVRDNGCGMDDATKQRIFEPFFTTKGVGRGTGMGLATVAGIIQQAGGFVEVESAPGVGTDMQVYFPRVSDRPATSAFDDRPEPIPGGRETVVVVEDDEILRTLVRRIIQVRGYEVLEAEHAEDALRVVRESPHPVSLVLMSATLQGANSEQLAAQLRRVSPRTRLIYVVDGGGDEGPLASLTEATDVLQKPFTSERLARKIRAVLDA